MISIKVASSPNMKPSFIVLSCFEIPFVQFEPTRLQPEDVGVDLSPDSIID